MAKKADGKVEKPQRKHCRSCTYYLDGKQVVKDDGVSLHFHPIPGMRHYRFTNGTIYDKIGTTVPCTCEAGIALEPGFSKNDGQYPANTVFKAWFSRENQLLISDDLLPVNVPMPMDGI